jgi:hypothetical protein
MSGLSHEESPDFVSFFRFLRGRMKTKIAKPYHRKPFHL